MPVKIDIPPGMIGKGTVYSSPGRWVRGNLVRWVSGVLRPWGGWSRRSGNPVTGAARSVIAWIDNGTARWIAIGTHSGLFVQDRLGAVYDITPSGYTVGRATAAAFGGYGTGPYGAGSYGAPRPDTSLLQPATIWALDTFGQDLLAISPDDGDLYLWQRNTSADAAVVSGAPTGRGVMVTEERFVMVLGAAGNPRRVQWSDQENLASWAPSSTNQAGDFDLQTEGIALAGRRVAGGTLIFTTTDIYRAQYVGLPFVYGFERLAVGAGPVSAGAMASNGAVCAWMSSGAFWFYDGFARKLECDVEDSVFLNLNRSQISQVTCMYQSQFDEFLWFYPSVSSTQIDSYASWNWRTGLWSTGMLPRTCGIAPGVYDKPIMIGVDSYVYEHEIGFGWDGLKPYIETGPYEINSSSTAGRIRYIAPDERTTGDVAIGFYLSDKPEDPEVYHGPFALTARTDLRLPAARIMRFRIEAVRSVSFTFGTPLIEFTEGGRR